MKLFLDLLVRFIWDFRFRILDSLYWSESTMKLSKLISITWELFLKKSNLNQQKRWERIESDRLDTSVSISLHLFCTLMDPILDQSMNQINESIPLIESSKLLEFFFCLAEDDMKNSLISYLHKYYLSHIMMRIVGAEWEYSIEIGLRIDSKAKNFEFPSLCNDTGALCWFHQTLMMRAIANEDALSLSL